MHITHLTALSASSPNRSHHSGGAGDTAAPPQMPIFIKSGLIDPLSSDHRLWTNPLISLKVSRVQHLYLAILTFSLR